MKRGLFVIGGVDYVDLQEASAIRTDSPFVLFMNHWREMNSKGEIPEITTDSTDGMMEFPAGWSRQLLLNRCIIMSDELEQHKDFMLRCAVKNGHPLVRVIRSEQ